MDIGKIQLSASEKQRVQRVRNVLVEMAELQPVPNRFEMIAHEDAVLIIDRKTDKRAYVPLSVYRNVRKVLNDLFS